jgi:hypothetical protein
MGVLARTCLRVVLISFGIVALAGPLSGYAHQTPPPGAGSGKGAQDRLSFTLKAILLFFKRNLICFRYH